MRHQDGNRPLGPGRDGVVQERRERRREMRGVRRIELASHGRLAHALTDLESEIGRGIDAKGRENESESPETDGSHASLYFHTPAIGWPQYSQRPSFTCISNTRKSVRLMMAFPHFGQ